MRDAAGVPQLQHDVAAVFVDGGGSLFPAGDLFGRMDARCGDVALAFGADLVGLGDDQPGAGALGVPEYRSAPCFKLLP
jgi:hypothetical protein